MCSPRLIALLTILATLKISWSPITPPSYIYICIKCFEDCSCRKILEHKSHLPCCSRSLHRFSKLSAHLAQFKEQIKITFKKLCGRLCKYAKVGEMDTFFVVTKEDRKKKLGEEEKKMLNERHGVMFDRWKCWQDQTRGSKASLTV